MVFKLLKITSMPLLLVGCSIDKENETSSSTSALEARIATLESEIEAASIREEERINRLQVQDKIIKRLRLRNSRPTAANRNENSEPIVIDPVSNTDQLETRIDEIEARQRATEEELLRAECEAANRKAWAEHYREQEKSSGGGLPFLPVDQIC